jgi:hypothetical protein
MGEEPARVRILADGGLLLDRREIGSMVAELIRYPDVDKIVLFIYSRVHSWWERRVEVVGVSSLPYVRCDAKTWVPAPGEDFGSVRSVWDMLSVVEKYCRSKST